MPDTLPVMLIPGLACTGALFSGQIPTLEKTRPVIVADHMRDNTMAAIAERALDEVAGRFHLAGLSMGGYVAFEILARAPDRVASLCLMDTTARPDAPDKTRQRFEALRAVAAGRYEEVTESTLDLSIAPSRRDDEALKQAIRDMARDTGPKAFVRQMRAIMTRRDARPLLPTISVPTLVIVGDSDEITPPDMAMEMVQGIFGARYAMVDECGHMSSMERPDQVASLLEGWLESA